MAQIGLKYMAWAEMLDEPIDAVPTYHPGIVLGRMVSTNLSITNAEGEMYADDQLAEYISEFSSAQWEAQVDNIELYNQAKVYGAKYTEDGELQNFAGDVAPYGGIGGYQQVMVRNVKKYRAWFFPKGKASIPDESAATRGNSISFGTQPIKMRIASPDYGPWKYTKEFTTEAAAKAYVDTKLNVKKWHWASVQVQGADGVTKAATPAGYTQVEEGGEFVLAITGTPTALYDNGVEKSADIADGKYTLAAVDADHTIAVIY